jgi:hypothetical protein
MKSDFLREKKYFQKEMLCFRRLSPAHDKKSHMISYKISSIGLSGQNPLVCQVCDRRRFHPHAVPGEDWRLQGFKSKGNAYLYMISCLISCLISYMVSCWGDIMYDIIYDIIYAMKTIYL